LTQISDLSILLPLAIACTELVRLIMDRIGFVSWPAADRWNPRKVALGGGIAIHFVVLLGLVLQGPQVTTALGLPLLLIFLVGIIDDIRGVKPKEKLIAQALAAGWVMYHGYVFQTSWPLFSYAITALWIVGLSNSVNLIDNMDGFAAGTGAIAASFLSLLLVNNDPKSAAVAFSVGMACLGFLTRNFPPAKIFMGDAGSLPLGFLLAVLSTRITFQNGISTAFALAPACLILLVPLFDTLLVATSRRSVGRSLLRGGRDHSSHRLVALGMSERKAVGSLYGLGITGGLCALSLCHAGERFILLLVAAPLVATQTLALVFLAVPVYPKEELEKAHPHRNKFLELGQCTAFLLLIWLLANFLGGGNPNFYRLWRVVAVKLCVLLLCWKFIGSWTSPSFRRGTLSLMVASILGCIAVATLLVLTHRSQYFHYAVIPLDGALTFLVFSKLHLGPEGLRWFKRKVSMQVRHLAKLPSPTALSH